jgi:hypothetical protein
MVPEFIWQSRAALVEQHSAFTWLLMPLSRVDACFGLRQKCQTEFGLANFSNTYRLPIHLATTP